MTTASLKLGRLPNDPSKPRLRLEPHVTAQAPPSASWTAVPAWGMLLNDQLGDCTCAGDGHLVDLITFYGQGAEQAVTDDEALAAYEQVGGYVPGDPSTDQGATVQSALSYLRKTGMGGRKIAAFAEIAPSATDAIRVACASLGGLSAGVSLPASAMSQFGAGEPWTVAADDGGIEGGHCIVLAGYDADWLYFVSWGQVQKASYDWWAKYGEEIWAVVSQDWVSAAGTDPEGVDLVALGAEFAALTGEPSPFTGTAPAPPAPGDSLLGELAVLVRSVAASADREISEIVGWLRARGL